MNSRRSLTLIACAAVLLRLLACSRLSGDEASLGNLPDQLEYLECGRNLLHGVGLNFVDRRFDQRVHAYRMPGYPLLIAACGGNLLAIRIVQCLLDASTTIAVYLIARKFLSDRAALIAAAIAMLNPFQVYFCGLILSETLFIALLTWSMWFVQVPAFACVATFVRPSATLLPFAIAAIIPAHRIRRLLLALVIESTLLLAWGFRNHSIVGAWIFSTTNSGVSLYDGLHDGATGASDQRFMAALPELRSMNEVERDRYLAERAGAFVKAQPLKTIKLAVVKLARFWSPVPLSEEYGKNRFLVVLALSFLTPLYGLTLIGIVLGNIPRHIKLLLLTPAVYFSLVHAVGVGSLRYRVPADVPMSVIAAGGAAALWGSRKMYGQTSADT